MSFFNRICAALKSKFLLKIVVQEHIQYEGNKLELIDFGTHYRYRIEKPGTRVGMPGRFQGLNIGVMLYKLDKIRKSSLYRHVVSIDFNINWKSWFHKDPTI